jgi:hypothetical protein
MFEKAARRINFHGEKRYLSWEWLGMARAFDMFSQRTWGFLSR